MYTLITVLIILAAIALILVVLVQKSKGSGLASGFASSNQIMGVRKTTDFIEKATWGLAGTIIVLSLMSAAFFKGEGVTEPQSEISAPNLNRPTETPDVNDNLSFPSPTAAPAPDQNQEAQN